MTETPALPGLLLVDAYEALADPALLSALVGGWQGEKLVLVLYAPDADTNTIVPKLEQLLAETDLLDHPSFELEALIVPSGQEAELAARVDALYSNKQPEGALAQLPAFGQSSLEALRQLLSNKSV